MSSRKAGDEIPRVQDPSGDAIKDLRHLAITVRGMAEYISEMADNESALISQVVKLNANLADLKPEIDKIPKLDRRGVWNRRLLWAAIVFFFLAALGGTLAWQRIRLDSLCDSYVNSRNDILVYNRAQIEFALANPDQANASDKAFIDRYQAFIEKRLPERHC